MIARKPVIAANWKMYKTPQEGYQFARQLVTKALNLQDIKFILYVSATGLFHIHQVLKNTAIDLGGQNMYFEAEGAFTGETSARMLTACGCRWVLVGHSERRHLFHESDEDVRKKAIAALEAGFQVTLCVGELLEERQAGRTQEVLQRQLSKGLAGLDSFPTDRIVIAYEPVWAIGTGVVATTEQAGEAHQEVRRVIQRLYPDLDVEQVTVLYGGSVKSKNAADLIRTPGVDGFLIGGASLDLDEYCRIAEIAQTEVRTVR